MDKIIFEILFIQVLLSVVKIIIIGGPRESLVGSVSSQGGAPASILPILGFIFLWMIRKGALSRKDLYFIIGLAFIGFAGAKRAIWFILPAIIAGFQFYASRRIIPTKYILISAFIIPLIFYAGVRLNPSLNPDHKIWGDFDLKFTFSYVEYYSIGDFEGDNERNRGRVNATMIVFKDLYQQKLSKDEWFGHGLKYIYASSVEEFYDMGFDISHKGSATGLYQTFIANGYVGIFAFLLFALSLISYAKNKRIRILLILFFLWEYLFYTGILLKEYSLAVLFIYIISISDSMINTTQLSKIEKKV